MIDKAKPGVVSEIGSENVRDIYLIIENMSLVFNINKENMSYKDKKNDIKMYNAHTVIFIKVYI